MSQLCACGCGRAVTGRYRVVRGHGDRAPTPPRPSQTQDRRSTRRATPEWRSTHLPDEPKPAPKMRPCLRCEQSFHSEGPYNCLCSTCRSAMANEPSPAHEYRLKVPTGRTARTPR